MACLVNGDDYAPEDLWRFLNEVSRQLEFLLEQRDQDLRHGSVDTTDCGQTEAVSPTSDRLSTESDPPPDTQVLPNWKQDHEQIIHIQDRMAPFNYDKKLQSSPAEAMQPFNQVQQVDLRDPQHYEGHYYYQLQQLEPQNQPQHQQQLVERSSELIYYQQQQQQFVINQASLQTGQTLNDCAYCNWLARFSSSHVQGSDYMSPS